MQKWWIMIPFQVTFGVVCLFCWIVTDLEQLLCVSKLYDISVSVNETQTKTIC